MQPQAFTLPQGILLKGQYSGQHFVAFQGSHLRSGVVQRGNQSTMACLPGIVVLKIIGIAASISDVVEMIPFVLSL